MNLDIHTTQPGILKNAMVSERRHTIYLSWLRYTSSVIRKKKLILLQIYCNSHQGLSTSKYVSLFGMMALDFPT